MARVRVCWPQGLATTAVRPDPKPYTAWCKSMKKDQKYFLAIRTHEAQQLIAHTNTPTTYNTKNEQQAFIDARKPGVLRPAPEPQELVHSLQSNQSSAVL